jgi:hypothetical protein
MASIPLHTLVTFSSPMNLLQALIKQAEAFLKAAQAKPGFGISILQVCFHIYMILMKFKAEADNFPLVKVHNYPSPPTTLASLFWGGESATVYTNPRPLFSLLADCHPK